MAFGTGWEINESDQFGESYNRHISGEPRLEDLIEGFVWALRDDPTGGPVRHHVSGTLWYAVLIGPPPYYVFFEVDNQSSRVTLEFVAPTP